MKLTCIILVYNEEIHLERCLKSIHEYIDDIVVVDSFSTDRTLSIAKEFTKVRVYQHAFDNHAAQFNWALENIKIESSWILRLDADEYLEENGINRLKLLLADYNSEEVGVVRLKLNRVYWGKTLKFGGTSLLLGRVISAKGVTYGDKLMDEKFITDKKTIDVDVCFYDHSLITYSTWLNKHVHYAQREADDVLNQNFGDSSVKRIYYSLPLIVRPFLFLLFRLFFQRGILDGIPGIMWALNQTLIYRLIVDINIYERSKQISK